MTQTQWRWLIISFWVFIVFMLIWQAVNYNSAKNQEALAHPQQEHYFFYGTNVVPAAPSAPPTSPVYAPKPVLDGPEQTDFSVEMNVPTLNMMTCHVTLKNMGKTQATNIQIKVCPYRGTWDGDEDVKNNVHGLKDSDPLAQYGEYLSFPDLDPGESNTQTIVLSTQGGNHETGSNPNPDIIFSSEKPKQ